MGSNGNGKQTEETKIAVLAANSEYMKRDISEIRDFLKDLPGVYVTQRELSDFISSTNDRFQLNEKESSSLSLKIDSLQKFMYISMGGLVVLTFVLKIFFKAL